MRISVLLTATLLCVTACTNQGIDKARLEEDAKLIQKEYLTLTDSFDNCVLRSSKIKFKSVPDKSAAVEYAFDACRTEENALKLRMASGISTGFAIQQVESHKLKLKNLLIKILPADGVNDLSATRSR